LALATLLAVAVVGSAPQQAPGYVVGRYPVEACTAAVGYENHSFTFATNNPTYIESHNSCGEPPVSGNPPTLANLSLGDTLGAHGVPVGTAGAWKLKAPQGTSISEISGSDSLMKVGGNMGWNVYLESEDSEGHTQLAQTCATSAEENECAVSGPFDVTGLDAKTITIGAECDAEEYAPGHTYSTCARGNEFGHAVRAGFNFVTVTLTDPQGPSSVTAPDIPTEPQHGSITIPGSATDTIAGLLSLSVIDSSNSLIGGPVTVPGKCNYSLLTPCPTSANDLPLPLDTETLPDGPNQIRVQATNAAHEQSTSPPYTLIIANHPSTPSSGSEEHGHPNGSTSSPTSPTNTETPPAPTHSTTGSPSLLPHLHIKLAKPSVRHDKLLLTGTAPLDANGVLQFTINGSLRDHRRWSAKAHATLHHTRFRCTIPLAKSLHRGATLEMFYPGSASYTATHLHWTVTL